MQILSGSSLLNDMFESIHNKICEGDSTSDFTLETLIFKESLLLII